MSSRGDLKTGKYWHMLEAEGRLKEQCAEMGWQYAYRYKGEPSPPEPRMTPYPYVYMTLRLTEEERERLLYSHGEPEDGADCGIAEFTDFDLLGES